MYNIFQSAHCMYQEQQGKQESSSPPKELTREIWHLLNRLWVPDTGHLSPTPYKKSLLMNFLISILPKWKIGFRNVPKVTGLLRRCQLPASHLRLIFTYTPLPREL